DDLVADLIRRRGRGEQVESAEREIKFRNLRNLVRERSELDEPLRGVHAPSELALEPCQPLAVPADTLTLGEPIADFDDIGDYPLAELSDRVGMLSQRGISERLAAVGRLGVILHSHWSLAGRTQHCVPGFLFRAAGPWC